MIGSAFMAALLAAYCWRRRTVAGGLWFAATLVSIAAWAFFAGLSDMALVPAAKILFCKLCYLGVATLATLWFIFAVRYSGRDAWLKGPVFLLFWVIPALVLTAAFTNEHHHLLWRSITPVPGTGGTFFRYEFGPVVFLNMAYSYLLLLTGMLILIRTSIISQKLFARQTLALLMAVVIPWACNVGYVTGLFPSGLDATPLGFMAAAGLVACSLFRYQLLDLLPVAHDTLFSVMSDGVVVVDRLNRIMEVNTAARDFFNLPEGCAGCPATELFASWPALLDILGGDSDERADIRCDIDKSPEDVERWFDVRVSAISDEHGRAKGRLLIFRDISERKELERDLMHLALTDNLTGVFNRRMGLTLLDKQLRFVERIQTPLTVCFIDINGLKAVNDQYGHNEGDDLILTITRVVRDSIREQDSLCRLGGDEFLVIQPNCTTANAEGFRRRLEESIERLNQDNPKPYRYGVACGIAEYHSGMLVSADRLIAMADAAMYREKSRICTTNT